MRHRNHDLIVVPTVQRPVPRWRFGVRRRSCCFIVYLGGTDRRIPALECMLMPKDVIVVRHPEFARLQHQMAVATERFNQATEAKQGSLTLIGSLQTITSENRKAFLEQIEAEQEAYEAIKALHEKIIRLLAEENQAKGATTHVR